MCYVAIFFFISSLLFVFYTKFLFLFEQEYIFLANQFCFFFGLKKDTSICFVHFLREYICNIIDQSKYNNEIHSFIYITWVCKNFEVKNIDVYIIIYHLE
jgi:hypothetical protein